MADLDYGVLTGDPAPLNEGTISPDGTNTVTYNTIVNGVAATPSLEIENYIVGGLESLTYIWTVYDDGEVGNPQVYTAP